jgi:hypothetical protein
MQFPVPQFTDVEDKIIGPLTLKQFGVVFLAGILIFLIYTASGKSLLVSAFAVMIIGLPALGVAFGKINGRPVYDSFGFVLRFLTSPKILIFHKQVLSIGSNAKLKKAELASQAQQSETEVAAKPKDRLKEIEKVLKKQAEEEKELASKFR